MKKRRQIVVILVCLVISSAFGIFALNINNAPQTEKDFYPQQPPQNNNQKRNTSQNNSQTRTFYNIKTKRETPIIELNAADTFDLQALKGVGPVFARRIWRYRMRLGGFRRIEQLQEVKDMSVELYNLLLPQISLDTTHIQKININTADFETLNNHPYIDYYIAKAIMKYRQKEGDFQCLEDLNAIYILEDSIFNKIKPYLTF